MSESAKPLKILMVTSEAAPYAKVGGLGDAVSSLAAELSRQGHDVRMILPRYYFIDTTKERLRKHPAPLGVPMSTREEWTGIWEGYLPGSGVPVYFIEHEASYGRDGVYGTRREPSFPDNVARFTLLCRAAFQLCRLLGWIPEIMHSHDWPAALCNVYLKTLERSTEFSQTAGVLTLHNVGYQGIFPKDDMTHIGLSWEHYFGSGFEYFDKLNLLQSGIKNADTITTVSPGYAGEVMLPEKGQGMDGLLRERIDHFTGILNGIDYNVWNPETDPLLPHHYSARNLEGKKRLKSLLRMETGLPDEEDKPLIGMVSRLVEQKGFGVLLRHGRRDLFSICRDLDLQMIILGTGDTVYEEELARLAWKLPNLKVILQFNNSLAHLIEAGSDFFLMPSIYEPCGLNQLYSLRYGSIPIVSNTGGLADTVEKYNPETGAGTGFIIDPINTESIYETVRLAVETFRERKVHLEKIRIRGMKKHFSWTESALAYVESYRKALDFRRGR